MHEDTKSMGKALVWSILTAGFLVCLKVVTGIVTHSMAILASALDSMMDVAASVVNLIAFREASRPPDQDHAYGHEKIESLAGLFQSVFICITGLYILYESARRFIVGTNLHVISVGISVMVVSLLLTTILVWRLSSEERKRSSMIMKSERFHYLTDIWSNAGVILALILVKLTQGAYWDLVISIIITFYIFKGAFDILRRSIDELLDRSLPLTSQREIESLIMAFHPSIVGVHNLRSRKAGPKHFFDFHIEIRGEDDFKKAHTMTEKLILKIQERYPAADVTVHYDPEGQS